MKRLYENLLSSDAVVPVSRTILRLVDGDYHAAALLAQCIYWSKRTKDPDGWFAKTAAEWYEELVLTRRHLDRATKRLQELCLETHIARSPYHQYVPCTFYRVDFDKLHDAIMRFLQTTPDNSLDSPKETETAAAQDQILPSSEDQNGEFVQSGLYSECNPECPPRTSPLHYNTKNYSIDLDSYMGLHTRVCKPNARAKPKRGDVRSERAKELLAAYRRVRYPNRPEYRETEFKMYRNALYALVDDHRTVEEVERATRAALERFSSKEMVNPNSIARHFEALLEENTQPRRSHISAEASRRACNNPAPMTHDELLQQQDELMRRALGNQYDAYFARKEENNEAAG